MKNIQTSWVKMGRDGAAACLDAGANDLGGTLMNESITRAAGAVHGEEMPPEAMEDVIASLRQTSTPANHILWRGRGRPDRRLLRRRAVAAAGADANRSTTTRPSNRPIHCARTLKSGDIGRSKMDFGVCLPTKAKSYEVVQRAEELGATHAWFYDTHLLSADVLVAMGAAAMKTSRIKLCAGVFIPSNRIAPVAANALATLNALAPGRVVFGVSTGYTGRRTMGLGPVTLARLEKYVEVVEGLLKGKTVEWSEEGGSHKVRFLNPELGLIDIKDPIPTFVSAFGPKARALTAKLGANWIGSSSFPQREQEDIEDMHAKWKAAGRDVKNLYVAASSGGCVLDEGEPADSPRAMAQAGPFAAIAFHNLVEEDQFGSVFPVGTAFPFQGGTGSLSQGISDLRASRRPLSLQSSRSLNVRPPGREAPFRHRRSRPDPDWHSCRACRPAQGHAGSRLQTSRCEHGARPGDRHARALVGGVREGLIVAN